MSTRAALLSAAASLVSAAPLPIDDRLVPQCTQISPLLTGPGTTVGTCGHPSLPCPSGSDINFKLCKNRCVTIDPLNDESVSGNLEYNEHTAKCTLVYTSQEAEADGRRMLQGAGAGDHAVCQKQVGPSSYCQGTVCHGSTVPCGGCGGPSPPSGTASGTLWLFPKAEGYTTEDLASAADGFSSVACLALSNKDCSAVTSQAAIDQWKSCEQSFGAKSQRWLLVNNDCARKWSNVEAGVAALTGLANSAGGGVVGLAYNPEGGDKHMIQTAIESIPNMKLAYSMGPSPSAGCPAAPQCSPTSRWTLLGQMYTLGADGLCRCFQRSTAGEKAECLASWEKEKYGPFAANSVGMFCVKTANTDLGECNETRQCGAIEGQGPHIEEFFAPNALKSVMPVLKGTSTSQDVALYLPQY